MKKKFLLIFVLYLILSNIAIVNAASPPADIVADSAILIDAKTGEILYEKNCRIQQYPASITKLMTVLLALENGNLSDTITFSEAAVYGIERNSNHIAIDVGEQLTMEQALYAIMLVSANEVSLGVGEHLDGSISAFAAHMTRRAKELGCENTNFVNANGLHDDNHYTTAYDMALIAKELLKFDYFKEIMKTTYYVIPPTNLQEEPRYLWGQHKMILENSPYYYEGCEGGKTGFTNQALNTLVSYAERDGMELIAVVLHDQGYNTYTDTAKLFDYGFENYETATVFSAAEYTTTIPVKQDYNDTIINAGKAEIVAESDIMATVPKGSAANKITIKTNLSDSLLVPVRSGDQVGTLEVYLQDQKLGETKLLSQNTCMGIPVSLLEQREQTSKLETIVTVLKVIAAIAGVLLVILLIARHMYFEHLAKKRRKRFRARYKSNQRIS